MTSTTVAWIIVIGYVVAVVALLSYISVTLIQPRRGGRGHRHPIEGKGPSANRRPRSGNCPGCGADESAFCSEDCELLDPMDWRG